METIEFVGENALIGLHLNLPKRLAASIVKDALDGGLTIGEFLSLQLIQAETAREEFEAAEERFLVGDPLLVPSDGDLIDRATQAESNGPTA